MMLSAFDSIFILLLLPILHQVYKRVTVRNRRTAAWWKVAIGFLLASMSLIGAGVVEIYRLKDIHDCGYHYQILGKRLTL